MKLVSSCYSLMVALFLLPLAAQAIPTSPEPAHAADSLVLYSTWFDY